MRNITVPGLRSAVAHGDTSFEGHGDHRDIHSFPTRRSSDLKRDLVSYSGGHLSLELEGKRTPRQASGRSEEHTSELQSRQYLVCRLLLEKKKADSMLI